MQTEQWRGVVGYEGRYEVSDLGNIRRLNKSGGKPALSLLAIDRRGNYPRAELWRNGVYRFQYVHRVVCAAFHPNPQNKPQVNHKDLNRTNNAAANLEWVTDDENRAHFLSTDVGKEMARAQFKLKDSEILGIFADRNAGMWLSELVKKYGASRGSIRSILKRESYRHALPPEATYANSCGPRIAQERSWGINHSIPVTREAGLWLQ